MALGGDGRPGLRIGPYVFQPTADDGQPAEPAFDQSDVNPHRDEIAPTDSWDFDPEIRLPNEPYRGVRRAVPARRHLTVIAAAGLLLACAVALVMVLKPGSDSPTPAAAESALFQPPDGGADQASSPPPSPASVVTSAPIASAPPVTPAIAVEAEAGPPTVKFHGARTEAMAGASGGKVVRFAGQSGQIEFRRIDITEPGRYRIAIYFASEQDAKAIVSVDNADPVTVTFAAGSACCAAAHVDVAMRAGGRSITISDARSGLAVDRVVITRLPS